MTFTNTPKRTCFESLRKRGVEKIMVSSAQPTRLSKLSFPRYATSLATTPRVRPTPALHILRAAQSTQRFCPPHGEVCRASARHDASIDLLAAVHSSAQGPLSAPNWIAHRARIFLCVTPPGDTPLLGWAVKTPMPSSAPHGDPHRTRHGDSQRATRDNPDGEHAALCSTPQGTTIQDCPSRHHWAKSRRATGTAPKRERRDVILSKGVWKSIRDKRDQFKETCSSRTSCMTKDGCVCLSCGSASAAASGRPEVWEDIGDRSAHGEGRATQHGSVIVRLSVWDRVAVGGGWMYTAAVPRSSCEASSRGATAIKQRSKTLPGPYPRAFATASCDRAQHKERGGPRRANPQKGHRVEQSSSRAETLATSHPVERKGLMQEKQTGGHQEIRIASKRFVRDLGRERTMPRPCTGPARFPPDVQDITRTHVWYSISVPLRLGRAIPRRSGTAFLVTCRCTYPRGIRAVR
ncbi:hypothetical protein EDB92DRAFT_1812134 [Lactarius akahatsu]|uniref:Uncharacterized protein n=1 Tax=Lactarius akahatsu TaxID=416441 RepID=A0AAD4LSX9_9AGAM|nr:hypothetical protein EDB92DRAFT_1812134 [Lactarius akahatsu]